MQKICGNVEHFAAQSTTGHTSKQQNTSNPLESVLKNSIFFHQSGNKWYMILILIMSLQENALEIDHNGMSSSVNMADALNKGCVI